MTIRVLLADDEALARRGLRLRLDRSDDIDVIAECATGDEALASIRRHEPDLAFLDVTMPGMSGLEVAAALDPDARPELIFVTGSEAHAVNAFKVAALDYVLKPIDDVRLARALTRARSAIAAARERDSGHRQSRSFDRVHADAAPELNARAPERLLARAGNRTILVRIDDIDWIEADGDYVSLHVGKKVWLVREVLRVVAERCAARGFVRIHKSTVVNLDRVDELRPLGNSDFMVVLRDGTELTMSRRYRHALDQLAAGGT